MSEIVMPRLSDTMEEGTILRWLVAEGETVRRGQEIVEIETDKANMTYESDLEGPIALMAAVGDTLPVGSVIARVGVPAPGAEGESEPGAGAEHGGAPDGSNEAPPGATPRAESSREDRPGATLGAESPRGATPSATTPTPSGQTAPSAPPPAEAPREEATPSATVPPGADADGERVKASPLARRIARDTGVDLRAIAGTGPGGRIVKADVQAATASGAERGAVSPQGGAEVSPVPPPRVGGIAGVATAKGETTEIELTRTQQTIARRMAESKATIPHFALSTEIDMAACAQLRSELERLTPNEPSVETGPTYNDMVVKACALALREHPRANSSYRDGRVQLHGRVNVGVAVAVDSEDPAGGGALIVPTVFDADLKSLGEIARETRALAARVRDGTVTPPELGGGTFTVSNLGMFGVSHFTAIVNPPQAAILSVGSLAPRPVVVDAETGEIAARPTMTVTLACDHRVLYGADAARLLARVRELLETPTALSL